MVDTLSFFWPGQVGLNIMSRHGTIAYMRRVVWSGLWLAAIARRPSTSSTRAAQGCAQWTHGGGAIDSSGGVMEPLTCYAASQGDAVAADPSACSPSLPPRRLMLPCVDTDRRVPVIRFMVILIALSIAQFLTLAATVSPSDTHI